MKSVFAPMHTNDSLHLAILARHPDAPANELEEITQRFRSEATRKIARALVASHPYSVFRAWAVQNALGR